MMMHQRTVEFARSKWQGILLSFGLPESALTGKHGPCPLCGGKDRFRWDNKDGRGTYICNHYGAGDGMALAMAFTRRRFSQVAAEVDAMLGNIRADAPSRPAMTGEQRANVLRAAWANSKPIERGDLADRYLSSRGVEERVYPNVLRFFPEMKDGEGGIRPCMIAAVGVYGELKFTTIHRTFLRPDGLAKAEMESPRKFMPGPIPEGACIQVSDWKGGPLGVAEGIETAMSASQLYDLPVWAVMGSAMMEKWLPPACCNEVIVFGDNDENYSGQAAAFKLANRLAIKGFEVTPPKIPLLPGDDWNDVWVRQRGKRF